MSPGLVEGGPALRRYLLASLGAIVLTALMLGIPTDLVPNPWFTRMIEAEPLNYFFWIATSILGGALLATYMLPGGAARSGSARTTGAVWGGGTLGLLAVGCPICNKLVVTLLGVSGALNYFAPLQPILGAVAVLLAASALVVRLRGAGGSCATGATQPTGLV